MSTDIGFTGFFVGLAIVAVLAIVTNSRRMSAIRKEFREKSRK